MKKDKKNISRIILCAAVYVVCLSVIAGSVFADVNAVSEMNKETALYEENRIAGISEAFHDQGHIYMSPIEPTVNESVTIRLRTVKYNVTRAQIQFTTDLGATWQVVDMKLESGVDETGYYDFWKGKIPAQSEPYYYRFICGNDDPDNVVYIDAHGKTLVESSADKGFYVKPGFKTPDWSKGALCYSIIPTYFNNGNTMNDRIQSGNDRESAWGTSGESYYSFAGGDLEGISQKMDYISNALNIDLVYINPIWKTDQNIGYGTIDYNQIDPNFGTEQDLIDMIETAHDNGTRVMLDAVLNYMNRESIWFNSSELYPFTGAAQSEDSKYFGIYRFFRWPDIYQLDWNNPILDFANDITQNLFYKASDSYLNRYLLAPYNADAWRFDVGNEIHGTDMTSTEIVCDIRKYLKENNSDAMLLSERATGSLVTEYAYDSRWNIDLMYTLRDWINGYETVATLADALSENTAELTRGMALSSQIYYENHDFAWLYNNTQNSKHMILAGQLLINTYLGSPMIRYGSETGLSQSAFDWNEENWDYDFFYRQKALGELRQEYTALKTGIVKEVLVDTAKGIYAFGRWDKDGTVVTVTSQNVANQTVELDVRQLDVADGTVLTDYLTGDEYTVEDGKISAYVMSGGTVLVTGKASNYRGCFQISNDSKQTKIIHSDTNNYILEGTGNFGGKKDKLEFISTEVFNNSSVIATVSDQTDGTVVIGLRADPDSKAENYTAVLTVEGKLSVMIREKNGKAAKTLIETDIPANSRIKVSRTDGNILSVSYAVPSGSGYSEFVPVKDSEVQLNMPEKIYAFIGVTDGYVELLDVACEKSDTLYYDDFSKERNPALADYGKTETSVENGNLTVGCDEGLGIVTMTPPAGNWTAKAELLATELKENEYFGVAGLSSEDAFVSAGRINIGGENLLYIGKATDGTLQVIGTVKDTEPDNPVQIQIQDIGSRYTAVYSYDGKIWNRLTDININANFSNADAALISASSEKVSFAWFSLGDSINDGASVNTPMTPGEINTEADGMEENQKRPKMVIASGNWDNTVGGIVQKDIADGRIDFTEKTYTDIRFNAVLRVQDGDGYVGVRFRHSGGNSGYLLKITADNDLILQAGKKDIASVKLTKAQVENGNIIIETYGSRILVYIGDTPVINIEDITFSSGSVSFITENAAGYFGNWQITDLDPSYLLRSVSGMINYKDYSASGFLEEDNGFTVPAFYRWSDSLGNAETGVAVLNGIAVTDFLLSYKVDLTVTSTNGECIAGVSVNSDIGDSKPDNGLCFAFSKQGKFYIMVDGETVQETSLTGQPDYVNVILVSQNGSYYVYIDDSAEPLLSYDSSVKNGGSPAFFSAYGNATFSDVKLYGLQPDEDYTKYAVFANRTRIVNTSKIATSVFKDDFSTKASESNFKVYNGNWNMNNGYLESTGISDGWNSGAALMNGKYENFRMSFFVRCDTEASWMAVEMRKSTPDQSHEGSAYSLLLYSNGKAGFYRSGETSIYEVEAGINANDWYFVDITVVGNQLKAYVNGQLAAEAVTDGSLTGGYISFNAGENAIGAFDNIMISPIN